MAKKRRSSQFKESSQVIDIEEARRKRQEKRKKQQQREQQQIAAAQKKQVRARVKAGRMKKNIIYAVIVLCIIAAVGVSIFNIVSFKADYNEAKAQHEQLIQQKKELEQQIKNSDKKDFIEKEAREQLRMVNPGETVYIVPFAEETTEATNENEKKDN